MINLSCVTKEYPTRKGCHRVLDRVSLEIGRGEKVGILGRNGAGKSTLIRLLSGAEYPTSGRIERTMSISWPLAFSGGFQGSMTGLDNLRFVCRVYGVNARSKLGFVRDFTELGPFLSEPIKHYSAGMRARLAFGISLVIDFDCFLIDEIISVGDERFRARCEYELFERRKEKAFVFAAHYAEFMRARCDRALVLRNGKLIEFRDIEEALRFYRQDASRSAPESMLS